MHLRSLTMKGFKSFADPTTVELEPGVTVVVGPNGSGKSNVVDAVAWVLGAQSARVVRSSKMDDVIFAGTAKRAPLGRAEVTLVVDNSDRRLPIEFSEVTIRRTLFRSGESEYELNGVQCRLLDIQELLSDTGVGRSQHVIISQGQLDAILSAHPEERRAVIEEAAGVLKYRRRRERAARRLEGTEQGLLRVQDMLREVRRQLRPLERQAASAHRHAALSTELEQLRRLLAAQELRALQALRTNLEERGADLARGAVEQTASAEELDVRLARYERDVANDSPEEMAAPIARLSQLLERGRGLRALGEERSRSRTTLLAALDDAAGIATLRETIGRTEAELLRCVEEEAELGPAGDELARAEAALVAARASASDDQQDSDSEVTARAAALRAQIRAARSQLEDRRSGLSRLSARVQTLREREATLVAEMAQSKALSETLRAELALKGEELDASRHGEAQADAARLAAERSLASASEERHGLESRIEALLDVLEGARREAGVELLFGLPGVLGTLLELVEVRAGAELAFEAAAEQALSAIVVAGAEDGRAAVEHLRAIGRPASLLVAPVARAAGSAASQLGVQRLRDEVRGADEWVDRALDQLLDNVVLARSGLDEAIELAARLPQMTVVTPEGDRLSPAGWHIGAPRTGATKAAIEASRSQLEEVSERHQLATAQLADATANLDRARRSRALLESEIAPLPARLQRASEAVAEKGAALEVVRSELEAGVLEHTGLEASVTAVAAELSEAEGSLVEVAARESLLLERRAAFDLARQQVDEESQGLARRRLDLEVRSATLLERRVVLEARVQELRSELRLRLQALEEAESKASGTLLEIDALGRLVRQLEQLAVGIASASTRLVHERDRRASRLSGLLHQLAELRGQRERVEQRLGSLREHRQRLEIEQTEARVRLEAATESIHSELSISPEELLALPDPELEVGIDPLGRRRQIERELREIGPVNLLAEEELGALSERNSFLEGQLEDIRTARRELNQVIRAVDAEIVGVFAAAFADVATNFERLITTLFPGGSGGISLTAPDDLLESGVEIEARPAGRNVRRLSLLSGGERSLVALAFLFAVFRSRPSPFYLMDEVEAALDDANLQRFLELLEDFRDEAQLVVVSHQKRTMEVADALYGVSMQPGGASKVVSERLRAGRGRPVGAEPARVNAAP